MTATLAVRPTPWQTLAQDFATPVDNTKELRQAAGLDWEPLTEPQYRMRNGAPVEVPGYKYVVHSGTDAVLDSANEKYQIFSNERMIQIAGTILGLAPKGLDLKYVAGGPLYGGKHVWLCAELGAEMFLPGDESPYVRHVVLSNRHDGHGALKVLPVAHRIFCANSIHRAELDAANRMAAFTFRHTSGIDKRVDAAKAALTATLAQFSQVEKIGTDMLGVTLSPETRHGILEEHALRVVLRRDLKGVKTPADVRNSPVALSAVNSTVAELEMLLGSPTCDGIQNTAWGVYQAMVEHADHIRPTLSPDRYVARTVLDRSADKLDGFRVLQSMHRR